MSETATVEQQLEDTDVAQASPDEEPVKAVPPMVGRFGLQAEHNQKWRLNVPVEVTPAQCMDEGFYAHISAHLLPGDEIRVLPDDMTWELVLHVVDAGRNFAQVAKKTYYDLGSKHARIALPPVYTFSYAGTTHKHRVLREGKLLKDGFATEALARRWAANHESAVNR